MAAKTQTQNTTALEPAGNLFEHRPAKKTTKPTESPSIKRKRDVGAVMSLMRGDTFTSYRMPQMMERYLASLQNRKCP